MRDPHWKYLVLIALLLFVVHFLLYPFRISGIMNPGPLLGEFWVNIGTSVLIFLTALWVSRSEWKSKGFMILNLLSAVGLATIIIAMYYTTDAHMDISEYKEFGDTSKYPAPAEDFQLAWFWVAVLFGVSLISFQSQRRSENKQE